MPSLPLSCCVINYNGEGVLRETLAAVCDPAAGLDEVLLIDNASTDGSLSLVRQHFPGVRVIRLPANRGPGAARNAGFREARHERMLFVDNDVIPEPAAAGQLQDALDLAPRASVALARILFASEPDIVQYDGGVSHYLGVVEIRHGGMPVVRAPDDVEPVGSAITAAFMIDRSRWPGGDPFDESFFIYLEDHDFGLRARALGSEIVLAPGARCRHREGTAGLSLRRTGVYARKRVFYLIRNRWQVLLKNYQAGTLAKLAPMLLVYEVFQLAGVVWKGWMPMWLSACWWIASHPGAIARKRRAIQRARRVADRDLLSGGRVPFAPELTPGRVERAAVEVLQRMTAAYWSGVRRVL